MSKPILIITSKEDVHADFVILEIRKLGCDVIRLNTEDLMVNSDFHVELFNCERWLVDFKLTDSDKAVTENGFDTVWYRKPLPVEVHEKDIEAHAKEFIEQECDFFLRSLYILFSHKRWINPYWNIRHASQKLPNLRLAKDLGLEIPRTLVTNSPTKAEEFAQSLDWDVIVKPFHFSGFVVNQTEVWHCFTNLVSQEDFNSFSNSIKLSPTLFQENVSKHIELRVTIIGQEVFCAAIHSQEMERTKHDWRAFDSYKVPHSVFQLPKDICSKLLAFNKHYSLSFSTFDLVLTPDEKYVFLECNPNGQWYWIEELTKMPMAQAMARLLVKNDVYLS